MDRDIADFALGYASGKKVDCAEVRAHTMDHEGPAMKNGTLDVYLSDADDGLHACVHGRRHRLRLNATAFSS